MPCELDARVAEEVMGWNVFDYLPTEERFPFIVIWGGEGKCLLHYNHEDPYQSQEFSPSTDMNAAMEVVKSLMDKGWHLKLEHIGYWEASFWGEDLDDVGEQPWDEHRNTDVNKADTPALAICLAALEAVKSVRRR